VQFDGLAIKALNTKHLTFDVALLVDNPNTFPIKLKSYRYKLALSGNKILSGSSDVGFTIKASGKQRVPIPILATYEEIKLVIASLNDQSSVAYRVDVETNISLPLIGAVPYKIAKEGTIPIPQAPQLSLKTLRVKNISMTAGGEFELIARLFNPNKFALRFSELNYQLTVKGDQWAKGQLDEVLNLPGEGMAEITVPIELSLYNIGAVLQEALQTGAISDYQLTGSINIDSDLAYLKNISMPFEVRSQ